MFLVTPVAAGKATGFLTPAAFITVAGMMMKPLILMAESKDELNAWADTMNVVPEWVNDCVDQQNAIDFDSL